MAFPYYKTLESAQNATTGAIGLRTLLYLEQGLSYVALEFSSLEYFSDAVLVKMAKKV